MSTAISVIYLIASYLIGSICSAVIVCKLFSLPDPRTEGSNNPGTTNVLRIAGPKYAIVVLIADMLKGFLPVLIAKLTGESTTMTGYIALAAVLGHIFPVFFKFKGGKGVATALGALFGMSWMLGGLTIITWLLVAAISRYSSLAAMIALIFAPIYSLFAFHNSEAFIPLGLILMTIIYKHHGNILRLVDGTEPKIKLKRG